jgi:hypothetical protein
MGVAQKTSERRWKNADLWRSEKWISMIPLMTDLYLVSLR